MNLGRGAATLASLALLITFAARVHASPTSDDLAERLRARGIRSARVLDAFRRVHREAFMAAGAREHASEDVALDIGYGQTMTQPSVLAQMVEQLGLKGNERVLEIGTGSGYDAAVLATLAHDVFSVEIVPDLAAAARLALTREAYLNVHVKQGDGTLGWREYGPYDAVVVTGAAPAVPRALVDQLKDGGVLVMPVGERGGRQVLLRGVKRGTKLHSKEIAELKPVPPLSVQRAPGERGAEVARPPRAEQEENQGARVRVRQPARDDESEDDRDARPRVRQPAREEDSDEDEPAATTRVRRPAPADEPRTPPALREERPARDLNEEDLPERVDPEPESDTRPLQAGRIRVARAPGVRDSGHPLAADAPEFEAVGSPAAARRCVA